MADAEAAATSIRQTNPTLGIVAWSNQTRPTINATFDEYVTLISARVSKILISSQELSLIDPAILANLYFFDQANLSTVLVSNSSTDNTTFFFVPSKGLSNGVYELVIEAKDRLHNANLYRSRFLIYTSAIGIRLLHPSRGSSPVNPFNITVATNRSSECRFTFSPGLIANASNVPGVYNSLRVFDASDGYTHLVRSHDFSSDFPTLLVACKDSDQIFSHALFTLGVDSSPPVILSAGANPNPLKDRIPGSTDAATTLEVRTSDRSICKYDDNETVFEQMGTSGNATRDGIFDRNDPGIVSTFLDFNTRYLVFPGVARAYSYNVVCQNLAGLNSLPSIISLSVTQASMSITVNSPLEFESASTLKVSLATDKAADCVYKIGSGQSLSAGSAGDGLTHNTTLSDTFTDGSYLFTFTCNPRAGGESAVSVQRTVLVDGSAPDAPSIFPKENPTCGTYNDDHPVLEARWNSTDLGSGIQKYGVGVQQGDEEPFVYSWKDFSGTSLKVSRTDAGRKLNASFTPYYFIVAAQNRAGKWSANSTSEAIRALSVEHPECRETVLPLTSIGVRRVRDGYSVTIQCSDSGSGCATSLTEYGLACSSSCTPSTNYSRAVFVNQSTQCSSDDGFYFCWHVFDRAGNEKSAVAKVNYTSGNVTINTTNNDPDGDGIPSDDGDFESDPCDGPVIVDCDDNCPTTFNSDQRDGDNDGRGDVCDTTVVGGTTCGSGDGCKGDCRPPDPDCPVASCEDDGYCKFDCRPYPDPDCGSCDPRDGCAGGQCIPADTDCGVTTCSGGDVCLAGCSPADPDCGVSTCDRGDGCAVGCNPADPDCGGGSCRPGDGCGGGGCYYDPDCDGATCRPGDLCLSGCLEDDSDCLDRTCDRGDGCIVGCKPLDPDCGGGDSCDAGDGCSSEVCSSPDSDCGGATCESDDGCLSACDEPDPDCSGARCESGDICVIGCRVLDQDCGGGTCEVGDGCGGGRCSEPDPDCGLSSCSAGDACLVNCNTPDPDCAGATCSGGDICAVGCSTPDPDCGGSGRRIIDPYDPGDDDSEDEDDSDSTRDTDGDGIPDEWEIEFGLQIDRDDSSEDPDNDGLTNIKEYQYGTHPLKFDTDGDGVSDGDEIAAGTNPLDASDYPGAGGILHLILIILGILLILLGAGYLVYQQSTKKEEEWKFTSEETSIPAWRGSSETIYPSVLPPVVEQTAKVSAVRKPSKTQQDATRLFGTFDEGSGKEKARKVLHSVIEHNPDFAKTLSHLVGGGDRDATLRGIMEDPELSKQEKDELMRVFKSISEEDIFEILMEIVDVWNRSHNIFAKLDAMIHQSRKKEEEEKPVQRKVDLTPFIPKKEEKKESSRETLRNILKEDRELKQKSGAKVRVGTTPIVKTAKKKVIRTSTAQKKSFKKKRK